MQGGLLYGCKISAELFQNFHLNLSFLTITCYFVLITGDQWAFGWEEGLYSGSGKELSGLTLFFIRN